MRILISGYYGFGNVGDEALLRVIVAELRTRYPLATLDVLSETPEATAHTFGITATPRWDQHAIRTAIERADIVLSGGGGLFQNATSLRSLLYYAGIVRTALRAGKRTMIFAQSIGPLDFWGKRTVRECCKGLHAATVRDGRSRALLAPLVPKTPVEQTADPVFLYDVPSRDGKDGDGDPFAGSGPLVIVAVRKTAHFADGVPLLAAAVDRLAERHGARVAFVPFGGVPDAEAATTIIRKCRSKPMLVPCDGLDAIAAAMVRAQLVIGVRLHALIVAIRFGIPFLAVPYDPKVAGLLEDIGYPLAPLWIPGTRATPHSVDLLVDEAWSRRAELTELLHAGAQRQRALARRNFDVLAALAAGS